MESKPGIAINSDHAIIVAQIKLKLKGELKKKAEGIKRYRSPNEHQIELYNKEINEKMSAYTADQQGNPSEQLTFVVACLADSASNNLTEISPHQKKSYITEPTWEQIEKRNVCRQQGDIDEEQVLNKKIKKMADTDKELFTVNKLEQAAGQKEKWQGIKDCKSKFVPNFTKQRDIRGNRVPPGKKSESIAEYLSEIQWKR